MSEKNKDYVVYGMKAKCSEGTMENYLTTDVGHGVTYQGQPLLNANDHTKQVNLTHFGDCNSKKIYEEAKKQADEKYKADAGDGFFAKAGKWLAKTVTKAVINVQEHLMFHKCELDTPLPWMFANDEHMIDGAPALTIESQCPCRLGGIITIVPVVSESEEIGTAAEETGEAEKNAVTATTETVMLETALAAAPTLTVSEVSKDGGKKAAKKFTKGKTGKSVPDLQQKIKKKAYKKSGNDIEKSPEEDKEQVIKDQIRNYVNEDVLGQINPRWTENMETFKKVYGDDVLEQMVDSMYQYEITDATSILMFLSTMGVETEYGTCIGQKLNGLSDEDYQSNRDDSGVPIISSSVGIGLLQVTGESQMYFIKDKYLSSEDEYEKKRIETYFNVTKDDFDSLKSSEYLELENAAGFIYENYPIEASAWYWGQTTMKCAIFDNGIQTNLSFNDYIEHYCDVNANMDNVFLAVQYNLNGRRNFKKGDIDDMCKCVTQVWEDTENEVKINGKSSSFPNGWEGRLSDWKNARKLLE